MLQRFTTRLDVPLRGSFDPEPRIAHASKAVIIKGMFLTRRRSARAGPRSSASSSARRATGAT